MSTHGGASCVFSASCVCSCTRLGVPTSYVADTKFVSAFGRDPRFYVSCRSKQPVGWYHSHPKFVSDPSPIDVENHQKHQVRERECTHMPPYSSLTRSLETTAAVVCCCLKSVRGVWCLMWCTAIAAEGL